MEKIKLFLKLNRNQLFKNIMLFFLFAFTGLIISTTLLAVQNKTEYLRPDMMDSTITDLNAVYLQMESILNVFSAVSIMIAVWGGITLLVFKDNAMEKTFVMCKIYGMTWRDLLYKTITDVAFLGLMAGVAGGAGGGCLFNHIVLRICKIHVQISSADMIIAIFKECIILCSVAFLGSLVSGTFVYNKDIMSVLNQRMNVTKNRLLRMILACGAVILAIEVFVFFHDSAKYIFVLFCMVIVIVLILYAVFHYVFHKRIQKGRNKKVLNSKLGLSYRFMCSRHKQDAAVAATLSVGAVLICGILNIRYNFAGIITDAYRDNMGYSVGLRVTDRDRTGEIRNKLEAHGYKYTLVYSKLVPYSMLNGMEKTEGEFWAAVIGEQTDNNAHFFVEPGKFAVEGYFSGYAGVVEGSDYEMFGKPLTCDRIITDNQALSLISYNLIINADDWDAGIDSSWSPLFLLDLDHSRVRELDGLMDDEACELETASMIADALEEIFSDYLAIVFIIGSMLIFVTFIFIYTVIQNDLITRSSELTLYRIYGASQLEAKSVVYHEYLMIAAISSFSVIVTVMILGEAFFVFFLQRHYPLSFKVAGIAMGIVIGFVIVCCYIAEIMSSNKNKVDFIRDE